MKSSNEIEVMAAHALQTLPDSLSRRRELLNAIVRTAQRGSDVRSSALYHLALLNEMDKAQATFVFPS